MPSTEVLDKTNFGQLFAVATKLSNFFPSNPRNETRFFKTIVLIAEVVCITAIKPISQILMNRFDPSILV
jgi:hypothetical protein